METSTTVANKDVLVVSPDWSLRRNGSRALLIDLDPTKLRYIVLDPIDAVTVALFDGARSISDVAQTLAYLLDIEPSHALNLVQALVARLNGDGTKRLVSEESLGESRYTVYDPKQFITQAQPMDHPTRLEVPICLGITPTHACHTRCRYCYAERRTVAADRQLSVEGWRALIEQAADLGICRINLLGGDPLAWPETPDVLAHLIKHGMDFSLSTKCHIAAELARRFAEMGMGKRTIQISMDAPNAQVADWLVGAPGFFARAVDSIANLIDAGLQVRAKGVLTPANVRLVAELVRLWYGMGLRDMQLVDYGRSHYHHSDDLFVSPEDSAWAKEQIEQLRQEFPDATIVYGAQSHSAAQGALAPHPEPLKWEKWSQRARCSAGSSSLAITPDGWVFLCEQIPQIPEHFVGDVRHQTILEVWNSERLLQYIYPDRALFAGSACYDCDRFDDCHRASGHCFRDALFAYGSRYMPPPTCPRAPAGAPRIY